MSSTSDKPPRKIIRLNKEEAATPEQGRADRRKPVRGHHLSLRERKARGGEAPETSPAVTPTPDASSSADTATPPRRRPLPTEAGTPRSERDKGAGGRRGGDQGQRRDSTQGQHKPPRSPRPRLQDFFAPCPRGLEDELVKELTELGATECLPASAGVGFRGDMALAWRVNLWSRLAIRVLWRLDKGRYLLEQDLYDAARLLPWPEWFGVNRTIAVHTVAHASPLKSLNFASLKIKDAVCDRFRDAVESRPNVDSREPQVPILLYLDRNEYSLYIDLSGAPLNRRGYRVEPAAAPINENLAAGLLRLAGWTPEIPLLDPMMGGGTILLEAAMMALNQAPGLKRHFAFENLANFDRVEWARLRKDAEAAALEPRELHIYGCDIDPAMVRATSKNLKAAGLLECVAIDEGDALEIPTPEENGILISNPPYGVRLSVEDMAAFYKGLGDALKQRFAGWDAYFISADPELPKQIGLKASRRKPLYNGPLECRLYEYQLIAGSMRKT